jgi:sugar/nucleoside kinase (ribokinase family)
MEGLDGEPFARIAAEARRRGILTSLDTVWDPTSRWSRLEPSLPHLDLAMPSLAEGRALSKEHEPPRVAAWLRDRGVREVALTMGQQGCYASGNGFEGHIAAPAVEAVDGTGAGDVFAAGLLYGKLAGWSFERSVRLGCAAGALSTLIVGATMGGRGLEEAVALAGRS